jgi:CheY-like chemotaxis protein
VVKEATAAARALAGQRVGLHAALEVERIALTEILEAEGAEVVGVEDAGELPIDLDAQVTVMPTGWRPETSAWDAQSDVGLRRVVVADVGLQERGSASTLVSKPVRPTRLLAAILGHQAPPPASAPRPVRPRPPRDLNHHVLVVDDNPDNQALVERALLSIGATVRLADHGAMAVQIFERERFDLILMDLEMPVMDGFRATEVMREIELRRDWERSPIVALTAHALEDHRRRCIEAGMDHFLTKPIAPTDLIDAVTRWADDRPLVLVVDDYEGQRRLLNRQLAKGTPCRRCFADSGREALATIQRGRVSLALVDLDMPGMGGIDVARGVARLGLSAPPTLVAFTGHGDAETRRECLAEGFADVLVKPVSNQQLIHFVSQYLDSAASANAPSSQPQRAEPKKAPVDDVADLVPTFLRHQRSALAGVDDQPENADQLRRFAHNLKGSAAGYGFPELGELAGALEAAVKEGLGASTAALLTQLREEIERVSAPEAGTSAVKA